MTNRASSRRSILLLLALVAAFAGLGLWFAQREETAREEALAPTPETKRVEPRVELARIDETPHRSAPSTAPPEVSAPAAIARDATLETADHRVSGIVIDVDGVPVPSATITVDTVSFEDAPTLARSAADGTFEFETKKTALDLIASTPVLRTLRAQSFHSERPEQGCIVVAPCADVNGVVVADTGEPIRGAHVSFAVPPHVLAGVERSLAGTVEPQTWSVATNAEGRFVYRRAVTVPGARIEARHSEFQSSGVGIPADTSVPVRVVLTRNPADSAAFITGVVLRQSEARAVDAQVYFAGERASVDGNAEFKLRLAANIAVDMPLVAIEPGSSPAVIANFGSMARQIARSSTPQRLVLGAPPQSISGRVLDGDGRPLEDAEVALLDPIVIGDDLTAESATSGKPDTRKTDAAGAFEISGLGPRDYRLQVFHDALYGRLESEPIRAGSTGVVLTYPADALVADLNGRVQGRDGTPIAGAMVYVSVVSKRVGYSSSTRGFRPKTTASDGSFHMDNMPRRLGAVQVMSPGVVNSTTPLEDLDLSRPVVITVDRLCSVRLEGLASSPEMRWMTALDAAGKELMIDIVDGESRRGSTRLQFKGAPPQFEVSEAAVEFVLYFPYDTLQSKRPVRLAPGAVNAVSW